jgi:hypothetical protein
MPVRVVDSSPLLTALPGANRARGTCLLSLSHMPSARAKLIVRAVARRTIGSYDNVASTAVSL